MARRSKRGKRHLRAAMLAARLVFATVMAILSLPPTAVGADDELEFAVRAGGAGVDQGQAVALDRSGNAYVTGSFQGTVDFDPGSGTTSLTSTGGSADVFVARYSPNGALVWARAVGGTGFDVGLGLAVDGTGLYVTGLFTGSVDFDRTTNSSGDTLAGAGSDDAFVLKLDPNGDFVWVRAVGGTGSDRGLGVAVDGTAVYVTGSFSGTADFDRTAGTPGDTLTSAGSDDAFVLRLRTDGSFVWARAVGGTSSDAGLGIATDTTGIYLTGSFQGTADFDPGSGVVNLTSGGGFSDLFVLKLRADGGFAWARAVGGTGFDRGLGAAADGDGVYVTGSFQGTVDFDPSAGVASLTSTGSDDAFVLKLDPDGSFAWAGAVGGATSDQGLDVAADGDGNGVYVTGSFMGTADFDPSADVVNRTSAGSDDVFVLKLGPDGTFAWVRTIGGSGGDLGIGVAADETRVYVTGYFQGTVDFDPGPETANRTSAGSDDIFVMQLEIELPNRPPTNTVPAAQATARDTPLVFSDAAGNRIGVADPDAYGNPVRVTLTATNGTLTLARSTGLSFASGDGVADPSMTFGGTIVAINAALDGLRFNPMPGFSGAATLQIVADDRGHTGSGGSRSDTDTVAIAVGGANTRPTISDIRDQTIDQNSQTPPLAFTVGDAETPAGALVVTARSDNPTLVPPTGIILTGGTASRALVVTPAGGRAGLATITVTVTDPQGATDTDTFRLTVRDVAQPGPPPGPGNRPPSAAADAFSGGLTTPLVVAAPGVLANDRDSDGNPLHAVLVRGPSRGRLALAGNGRFVYIPGRAFRGRDSFSYRASDGAASSNVATVTITTPTCFGRLATIVGTPGNDVLNGTRGDDVIAGLGGNDVLRGFGGNDRLCGGQGNDRLLGGLGNDRVDGEGGNDAAFGEAGTDIVRGGPGNDVLDGGPGADLLDGGPGLDTLRGGAGNDRLLGGPDNDRLFGDAGDDLLNGGPARDTCVGGPGTDSAPACEIRGTIP